MQTIYAMHQHQSDNLEKEEKFLFHSIDAIQDLYLTMLSSLIEICKKEQKIIAYAAPRRGNNNQSHRLAAVKNMVPVIAELSQIP